MVNNKIKYILALFIILCLSMNAFSATNFTDDSNDAALQSSSSVDEVVADGADDSSNQDDDSSNGNQNGDTGNGGEGDGNTNTNTNTNTGSGNGSTKPTFNFNTTGSGNGSSKSSFNFNWTGNGTGSSFSNMSLDDILDIFSKLMGGNSTDATNTTPNETVDPEVSDVPEVATSTSYAPVSHPVESHAQHTVTRVRDNKIISQGDTLKLEGINKLFDSDFTNGHLLVYIDGKLIFNELTTDDLSTPIFGITDSYLGQHQIKVEFTADGDSNTNKYTEDVIIS